MATAWAYGIQEVQAIPEGLHVSFLVAVFGDEIKGNLENIGLSVVVPFSSTIADIQNAMADKIAEIAADHKLAITSADVQLPQATQSPLTVAMQAGQVTLG